ncbi:hypothetical protein B7494_g4965 [Chlorociboria aeruginascens]|nr:hypothetical protein B7494_g4965 [Chlorociboria aeruginascens]
MASRISCPFRGCGQTLSKRGDLARHQKEKHGDRLFCREPGCRFRGTRRVYRLREHMYKYHGSAFSARGVELYVPENLAGLCYVDYVQAQPHILVQASVQAATDFPNGYLSALMNSSPTSPNPLTFPHQVSEELMSPAMSTSSWGSNSTIHNIIEQDNVSPSASISSWYNYSPSYFTQESLPVCDDKPSTSQSP